MVMNEQVKKVHTTTDPVYRKKVKLFIDSIQSRVPSSSFAYFPRKKPGRRDNSNLITERHGRVISPGCSSHLQCKHESQDPCIRPKAPLIAVRETIQYSIHGDLLEMIVSEPRLWCVFGPVWSSRPLAPPTLCTAFTHSSQP